jgi:autophagy-related protein 9
MFCIDYSQLSSKHKFSEIKVPKCSRNLPAYWNLFLWLFVLGWLYSLFSYVREIPKLIDLHNFFLHLLEIPDREIQSVSWPYVVGRLMALRDANPATAAGISPENRRFISGQSKQRMDAHDIANRLMRKDNYWIAIINRDILDTTIYIPFLGKRQFFSRTIQWNLDLTVNDFVFDAQSQIRPSFLTTRNRKNLVDALKRRFLLVGVMNLIIAPFVVTYQIVRHFFQMFMVLLHSISNVP